MRSSRKPNHSFSEIYDICACSRKDPLRTQLIDIKEEIEECCKFYEDKISDLKAYEIVAIDKDSIKPVNCSDLGNLYSDKLVNGPARFVYDDILVNAKSKGCCFCTYGEPIELDHYLAKTKFPELSINPLNLIPSCSQCNKKKGAHHPSVLEDTFFHPYFEDITDKLVWLDAKILYQDEDPIIEYGISSNLSCKDHARFKFQFYKLRLNERYSIQAAREISSRRNRWENIFDEQGAKGVRRDIELEMNSYCLNNKNSWKTALYRCLKENKKFCNMDWCITGPSL